MQKFRYYPARNVVRIFNAIKPKKEVKPRRKWYSWGYSGSKCRGQLEFYVIQYEEFYKETDEFRLKWNNCRIDCELAINKVAYNFDNAWERREYEILKRLNEFTVKDILQVSSLFIKKADIECPNLEVFTERLLLKSNPIKPVKTKTWNKSRERAGYEFRKFLRNETRNDFERQSLWDLCLMNIFVNNPLSRPFKNIDSGFVGINKLK